VGLGETGQLNQLVETHKRFKKALSNPIYQSHMALCRLRLFAYSGRGEAVEKMIAGPLASLAPDLKRLWRAVAEAATGSSGTARPHFEELTESNSYPTRLLARNRLVKPLADPARILSKEQQEFIDAEEKEIGQESQFGMPLSLIRHKKRAFATYSLMVAILAMFILETQSGGSTNILSLYRLGAIVKAPGFPGEWWRSVTALFLHFGALHLLLNLVSLFIIGPYVENSLRVPRFLAVYFFSGVGSMLLAVQLYSYPVLILVGASGSIMGLLGAMAYILYCGYTKDKSRAAFRSLSVVVLIFLMQIMHDLTIPQSSLNAHLAGFFLGLFSTLLLWRPSKAPGDEKKTETLK
jgi:rhomboid protease GluP